MQGGKWDDNRSPVTDWGIAGHFTLSIAMDNCIEKQFIMERLEYFRFLSLTFP